MESKTRRQLGLLGVLVVVLAAALWWNFAVPAVPQSPQPRARSAARPAPRGTPAAAPVEQVRLDALTASRPEPATGGRDPFRFRAPGPGRGQGPDIAPPDIPADVGPSADAPIVPSGPPPIPLRFIGVMRLPQSGRLIAVLSDGNGVYRGSEGDIIEGRYRIVRLRPEAVELAYVDGQGHQVIRLSGS